MAVEDAPIAKAEWADVVVSGVPMDDSGVPVQPKRASRYAMAGI